jgi:prophage regulatory protein
MHREALALLRIETVTQLTGLSRSQIYKLVALGAFPRPVPMGKDSKRRAWVHHEVNEWIEFCISLRDSNHHLNSDT